MRRSKRGGFLLAAGCALLGCALLLTAYNLVSESRADRQAAETAQALQALLPDVRRDALSELESAAGSETEVLSSSGQTVSLDGQTYLGILEIPAIGVTLPVNSQLSSALLRSSPCRYQGSAETRDLIIAGHNFDRHFGGLKLLQAGDQVTFTDGNGLVCRYVVSETQTLSGTDVSGMSAGDWDLTLFTCTYGGVNRVTVRCRLAESSADSSAAAGTSQPSAG